MRVLVLGGDGMLGHRLLLEFAQDHTVTVTLRQQAEAYRQYGVLARGSAVYGIDARTVDQLSAVVASVKPDAVVNAIGIVKQRQAASDVIQSLEINALLPNRLAEICATASARLVHISTDCVFSGAQGGYTEDDVGDATDLYGRTKLLGEVAGQGCVTLRTSIIGLELKRRRSLIEWYLASRGPIRGFSRAIYSGLTTMELARVIRHLLEGFPDCHGLYHVVSEPISKYEILRQLTELLGRTDVVVEPDDSYRCDRSMHGGRFTQAIGYTAPPWHEMLEELAREIKEERAI